MPAPNLYEARFTLRIAVEANTMAEAGREIRKLREQARRELPDGVSLNSAADINVKLV